MISFIQASVPLGALVFEGYCEDQCVSLLSKLDLFNEVSNKKKNVVFHFHFSPLLFGISLPSDNLEVGN